uniref:Uncharacterized protein n=1 Tax=Solanum lycopersicum TaxID=4081 RepID=A0A3Q7FCW4_SOLLC
MESEVAFINLSATIFVPLDAKTCADFSTEATTTFTFARLRMSIKVTTSISSDPLAIGIRTYKIVKMEHIDMSCEINYSQENIINPRTQVQSPIKSDKQQCSHLLDIFTYKVITEAVPASELQGNTNN